MNLHDAAKLSEDAARAYLERIRWPNGPVCPHCGDEQRAFRLRGAATRPGVWKCGACREQFTVTVGTVMHRSRIPLTKWVFAFHMMCASKKGVSAHQLYRTLGLGSYRTAWHMAHRIRFAMKEEPLASMLRGTVEADETYIGGKTHGGKRGRGAPKKTAVLALVERNGRVRSKPVERVNAAHLKGAIRESVHVDSRIMTDEWFGYQGIGVEFSRGHGVVRHGIREYVSGDSHTNTAESFFALFKRGVHGTFHHVSKRHLGRYCDEFSFRWNHRRITDGQRTEVAIRQVSGKRLTFKPLVARSQ